MTNLTQALEQLDRAITRLESAIDAKVKRLDTQQRDLFAHIETERDRTQMVARELDGIIGHLEKTLSSNETQVRA